MGHDFDWGEETGADPCVYCGMPAGSVDHAIPQSYMAAMSDTIAPLDKTRRAFGTVVASCLECNVLLGNCALHTEAERRSYVKEKLRKRYRRLLEAPAWTAGELDELKGRLREMVIASQARRELVEARLRWPSP